MPKRAWLFLMAGCAAVESSSGFHLDGPVPSDPDGLSNALYQATGARVMAGNSVELVNNGALFARLAEDLAQAKHSIDIVTFIWRPGDPSDRLLPIIVERARAGIECRIAVDALASTGFAERVQPTLEEAGCQVRRARRGPTVDRNHRKIVIVDGRTGYTGGFGIDPRWLGDGRAHDEWRDSNVRVRGPAVAQMEQAFADTWIEESGTLLPPSHFPELAAEGDVRAAFVPSRQNRHVTTAERLSHLIIAAAKRRVWIANSYFVPSPGLTELLREKSSQGVDVRVMVPSDDTDHPEVLLVQRTHYKELLQAGVRVFEYQPAMFHPKTMLVDDSLTVVGSINFDRLSQELLDEGSLVAHDAALAAALERDWLSDETRCREVR